MKELLEQLLNEAHPNATLPAVIREKMMLDLAIQLEQRLYAAVAEHLDAEQSLMLASALTHPENYQAIEAILSQVPNYQAVLVEVYQTLRQEYLQICQAQ
jgi:hypothetical protein